MERRQTDERWEVININALADLLAEEDWKKDVTGIPHSDIYDIARVEDPHTGEVEVVTTVKEYWTGNFFALRDQYLSLILSYTKDKEDGTG